MIGYVTLGTNDFERAAGFYDALLSIIGIERLWTYNSTAGWGPSGERASLCLVVPVDGNAASVGNGTMVAIQVSSPEQVRELYEKAIELGGSSEGEPGPRGTGGFYGGYFRDLDGNKLNAHIPEP